MVESASPGGPLEVTAKGPWRQRITIQRMLLAGFGLVFVLWLASGIDLVRRTLEVEERAAAVSTRQGAVYRQLLAVRVSVLTASVFARDALLDVRPNADDYYREQLRLARTSAESALDAYAAGAQSPAERENVRRLREEVLAFWNMVVPVLRLEVTSRAEEVRKLLREEVIPKRRMIFQISDRVQELNRVALARERAEVNQIYSAMRRQILWTSGLAILGSVLVAAGVIRTAGRLERRIREQMLKDAENTRDLQRLSAMLVRAQEDERRTIARELHDEIGQALTAIKVELSMAGSGVGPTEREDAAFREVRRLTDHSLQLVRDLSQVLHPAMLDDLGLPETVAWYLNTFSSRTGIRTDLVQDRMQERLAGEIETCLYRIVQEALTNVARHAEATSCRVYLQRLPSTILLTVEDDGRGFPSPNGEPEAGRRGLGLLGIQERVSGFRGSLKIETAAARGTRLTVELPALPRQAPVTEPDRDPTSGPQPEEKT